MSAHVLLNLLNELEKMIRCMAMSSILSVSPTSLINSMKKVSISNAYQIPPPVQCQCDLENEDTVTKI